MTAYVLLRVSLGTHYKWHPAFDGPWLGQYAALELTGLSYFVLALLKLQVLFEPNVRKRQEISEEVEDKIFPRMLKKSCPLIAHCFLCSAA